MAAKANEIVKMSRHRQGPGGRGVFQREGPGAQSTLESVSLSSWLGPRVLVRESNDREENMVGADFRRPSKLH